MGRRQTEQNTDELVYAVDLTKAELKRSEEEIRSNEVTKPPSIPDAPRCSIKFLALIFDDQEEPFLLPIDPTQDVVYLDALARLLRIASLSGETVSSVAINYGESLERTLAFERKLPTWAYEGISSDLARKLPRNLQLVLAPKKHHPSRR